MTYVIHSLNNILLKNKDKKPLDMFILDVFKNV